MVNKFAVIASTNGTDMIALHDAIENGTLDAEIGVVISNRVDCGAVQKAKDWGVPFEAVDSREMSKEDYEKWILGVLDKYSPELILLIGYNKIVSDEMCNRYENKIVNVHPSLLPAFGGAFNEDNHAAVLEKGVKVSGCTLHFVTPELDNGPIIIQRCVPIKNDETVNTLKAKIQKEEGEGFIDVVRLFFEGRITVNGHVVRIR